MPRTASSTLPKKRGAAVAKVPAVIARLRATAIDTSDHEAAALTNPNRPLTEKMRAFVRHWASGETILTASYRAGYNDAGAYAYRLAKMPHILRLYEAEKQKYEADSSMTRKRVIDGMLEGIEMAKLVSEPSSVISGWREIGKMCGYYAPVEVKHTVDVHGNALAERLNRLSDAELLKLMNEDPHQVIDVDMPEVPGGDEPE